MAVMAGRPRFVEFKADNEAMLGRLREPLHRALDGRSHSLRRGDRGRGARRRGAREHHRPLGAAAPPVRPRGAGAGLRVFGREERRREVRLLASVAADDSGPGGRRNCELRLALRRSLCRSGPACAPAAAPVRIACPRGSGVHGTRLAPETVAGRHHGHRHPPGHPQPRAARVADPARREGPRAEGPPPLRGERRRGGGGASRCRLRERRGADRLQPVGGPEPGRASARRPASRAPRLRAARAGPDRPRLLAPGPRPRRRHPRAGGTQGHGHRPRGHRGRGRTARRSSPACPRSRAPWR